VSQLANRFVKDPRDVVKAGQVVKVKVVECDLKRRRISLTMKLDADVTTGRNPAAPDATPAGPRGARGPRPADAAPRKPASPQTSFAAAFAKLSGKE